MLEKKKPGPPKGVRIGGRAKGTPNKATAEKALIAERVVQEAQMAGRKLGKEVLADFMDLFAALAAYHQPLPDGQPVPLDRKPDDVKFEKYARLAIQSAKDLAPYQSPTFRSIQVAAPAPERKGETKRKFTLMVFDGARGGDRDPKQIELKAKRAAGEKL